MDYPIPDGQHRQTSSHHRTGESILNSNSKNGRQASRLRALLAAGLVAAGLCLATAATATPISISASIGGAPTGTSYENFNTLALGGAGGTTASGIEVQFSGSGMAVQGAAPSLYAPPFLSNGNGTLFGDPTNGADTTVYLSTGTGSVTLLLPTAAKYLGLLWGSVDDFNTLSFYSGTTLLNTVTGNDVTALPDGDQGINGTFYVNFNSSISFDRIVASSTSNAFEFDNVAFNETRTDVPEPGITSVFLLGLLFIGSGYWYRRRLA